MSTLSFTKSSDTTFASLAQSFTISSDTTFVGPTSFTKLSDTTFTPPFITTASDTFFEAASATSISSDTWFETNPINNPPCFTCAAPIDCPNDNPYLYSLTSDPTLPFVENCPAGFDCNAAQTVNFDCCGHIISVSRPANATGVQIQAMVQSILSQCSQWNAQCGLPLPTGNLNQTIVYAGYGFCTVMCPDGTPFTFQTSELYWAFSQAQLNATAGSAACKQANAHKICIGSLTNTLPVDVPFTQKLLATGFLAIDPVENEWTITGDIPPGMTFDDGFFATGDGPTLTGTPTTNGDYQITVKVTNPNGDSQTKVFTETVFGLSVTPTVLSAAVSYFNSGASFAAGTYIISYVDGAFQAGGAMSGFQVWDYVINYGGGSTHFLPANVGTFSTQAQAESANAGKTKLIVHSGGQIGMWLSDMPYTDNIAGSPAPTFSLVQIA